MRHGFGAGLGAGFGAGLGAGLGVGLGLGLAAALAAAGGFAVLVWLETPPRPRLRADERPQSP